MAKNKTILLCIIMLLLGLAAGYFIRGMFQSDDNTPSQNEVPANQDGNEIRSGGYNFINPLLECDNFHPSKHQSAVDLESDLRSYIETVLNGKKAQHVSVYYRELNSGPWIGINENDNYSPASLLKVPVAIAALKRAEKEPAFLKKKILYPAPQVTISMANMNDTVWLKRRNTYTVEELIEYTSAYSDNEAMMLLLDATGKDLVAKVMNDLDIKKQGNSGDFVSVKNYSSMFRLLYNATYLSKDMSEKMLAIMSKAVYKDGIVAGLPASVKTSHKFGERAFDNSDVKQLHDCGIIYNGASPYLLCVMTRGNNFKQLESVVADISAMVYKKATDAGKANP